jgi:hypothetical protein
MSFAAGDANVSRYVGNASVSNADPTGLDGMDIKMDIWIRARNREHRDDPPPPPRISERQGPRIPYEPIVDVIRRQMLDYYRDVVQKGNGENHCYAYRDAVQCNQLSTRDVSVIDGGVRNWWGPTVKTLYLPLDWYDGTPPEPPGGVSDGGVFVVGKDVTLYIHAVPYPVGPPKIYVELYDPFGYLLLQPPIGQAHLGRLPSIYDSDCDWPFGCP